MLESCNCKLYFILEPPIRDSIVRDPIAPQISTGRLRATSPLHYGDSSGNPPRSSPEDLFNVRAPDRLGTSLPWVRRLEDSVQFLQRSSLGLNIEEVDEHELE
jgi:hypothetical protein